LDEILLTGTGQGETRSEHRECRCQHGEDQARPAGPGRAKVRGSRAGREGFRLKVGRNEVHHTHCYYESAAGCDAGPENSFCG
jgi:hypothetical protein